MTQNANLAALSAAGVSVWLDDLSRDRLQSGNLKELIDTKSVVGVTTNPSIFQKALADGDAYNAQIAELAERGADVDATIRTVTTDDVRNACDVLAPQWESSDGIDGRVSIEVDPRLAKEADKTAAQAIELWKIVDRPNLLIKIPATEAGLPAFQAQAWNAIFAPKGTPAPVVAKLNAAAVKALDDEGVRKRLLDLGSVIPAAAERTPEALAALVKSEIAKWTPVLKPATN